MPKSYTVRAVKVICNNCKEETYGLQDEQGVTRIQCAKCGTVTVSKIMSRRHVQLNIFAPKGQVLLQEIE